LGLWCRCSIHQYHKDEFPGTGGRENVERNDAGEPWIVNCPIPYTVPKEMRPNADDLDSGVWRQKVRPTATKTSRIGSLGLVRGDRDWSLNEGQRLNFRVVLFTSLISKWW
jgi:hypothetical protein